MSVCLSSQRWGAWAHDPVAVGKMPAAAFLKALLLCPPEVHFKLALKRQRTQICTKSANVDGKPLLSLRCGTFSDDNDRLTV